MSKAVDRLVAGTRPLVEVFDLGRARACRAREFRCLSAVWTKREMSRLSRNWQSWANNWARVWACSWALRSARRRSWRNEKRPNTASAATGKRMRNACHTKAGLRWPYAPAICFFMPSTLGGQPAGSCHGFAKLPRRQSFTRVTSSTIAGASGFCSALITWSMRPKVVSGSNFLQGTFFLLSHPVVHFRIIPNIDSADGGV